MLFEDVKTEKTEDGYRITWDLAIPGEVEIYWSENPGFAKEDGKFLVKTQQDEYTAKLDAMRPYFLLIYENGEKIRTAERVIKMGNIKNFRDIGGYPTEDGKWVCWGKLYRSAAHDDAADEDLAFIKAIGLKTVMDYRSATEFAEQPDRRVEGVNYISNPVFRDAGAADILRARLDSPQHAIEAMQELNENFVKEKHSREAYRKLFQTVLQEENVPSLQHCSAGKDRVGAGVAIFLKTLGVAEDVIIEDYLLSNLGVLSIGKFMRVMKDSSEATPERIAIFEIMRGVREEFIKSFFTTVEKEYGSFEQFLTKGLELTEDEIRRFREQFTESL